MEIGYLKEAEFLLRILLAAICGGVIGYERKNRGKGAGVRTHTIVAVASCLMMIIAQYGFADFFNYMDKMKIDTRLDPSRVAAQIVSGVGFLGAGMIFVQKKVVTGLTTAAGIWAVSGIGMAVGGGMYFLGVACTVIIFIIQIIYHKNFKFFHFSSDEIITLVTNDSEDIFDRIIKIFAEEKISASITGFSKSGDEIEITVTASVRQGDDLTPIVARLQMEKDIQRLISA